jgi:hypothetical protein
MTTIDGVVKDERGQPVEYAVVELRREGSEQPARAETDSAGEYTVTVIDGPWGLDQFVLIATKRGYVTKQVNIKAGGRRRMEITLVAAGPQE